MDIHNNKYRLYYIYRTIVDLQMAEARIENTFSFASHTKYP